MTSRCSLSMLCFFGHTHCVCALNSFSFVWLGAADFTTSKSLRNPTLLRPSRTSLTICASEFCFFPHHYYSLPINFGFIQIQWPNDTFTFNFTLRPQLCSSLLHFCVALLALFSVSSHRTALRYDLAVSCFLLTVLRHKICCCGCLLTNHFTRLAVCSSHLQLGFTRSLSLRALAS